MPTQLERRTATREALIASASELITQGGFVEASCEEIGARAGMSRGAVNYTFGTKGGLLSAVIEHGAEHWQRDHEPVDPDLGLVHWLDAMWAAWRADPCRSRLVCMLLFEATGPSRKVQARTAPLQDRAHAYLRGAVADLQLAGQLPPRLNPGLSAQALLTAATGLITQHATAPGTDADAAFRIQRDLFAAAWVTGRS